MALRCRARGAACEIHAVDTTDAALLEDAAWATVKRFGGIDVWINNAGVGALGSFTDTPLEEHRRLIDVNVMGYINGAHIALKIFKRQGHGVLIQNASIASRLAPPHLASYVTSKFAIRGLTHALRQDLALEGWRNIHVCQVNPSVISTPVFRNSSNHSGYAAPMRMPTAPPEHVARAMVRLSRHPRREVFVGPLSWLGSLAYTLLPGLTAAILVQATRLYRARAPRTEPSRAGSLFRPADLH